MSCPSCVHVAGTQHIGCEACKLLLTKSVQHLCPRLRLQCSGGWCEQREPMADVFKRKSPGEILQQLCLYRGLQGTGGW